MAFEEVCEETFGKAYAILFYGETVSLFFFVSLLQWKILYGFLKVPLDLTVFAVTFGFVCLFVCFCLLLS